MLKRIFALALSLLLLMSLCLSLTGCDDDKKNDESKSDVSTDDTFFGFEIPDSVDFGGKTVRVLTTATAQTASTFQIQPESNSMYSAENASAVISTALECTRSVEQELGITVEEEVIYTFSRYGGEMYQRICKDAMSYVGDYVFAMPCSIEASMLAIDDLLYDLNDVPHIDLSREWWCQQFNDGVTINGKTFFAISDIGTVSKDATLFIAFNKKMADSYQLAQKYGYESLYDMVDAKAWTQDRMFEMARTVYQDTNGNNRCDKGDVNGLAGQDGAIYNLLTAAGEKIIGLDSDGYPTIAVDSQRAITIIGKAQENLKNPKSGFISANDYFGESGVPVRDVIVPEFKADRCLFFMDAILNLDLIRDMESDFGVLPVPLYDKNQDGYKSQIGCWSTNCIVVPTFVTGEDLEIAGYLIEALSAVSNKKLNPVYYEQTLQYQIARDDDSMRMLDIIFDSRTCELAEVYNLEIYNTVCGMLKKPQGTFVSEFQAVKELTETALDEIIGEYKSHK